MSDWSHGYNVSLGYSYTFYREMAPDWLDFCARDAGFEPVRQGPPFRYLELGAGQGLGLCLLAAANPQAQFVGVDFQPEHAAHAQGLIESAGLTNIRFVEADFAKLAAAWPDDFGTFDYVALHGVFSWVSVELRDAVFQCVSHGTHPGSLVYTGYNSQPSWLSMGPFHHIARLIKGSTDASSAEVLDRSITLFERLQRLNAPGFQVLPALPARLHTLKNQDISYSSHEYLNDHWQPLWHSAVASQFARSGFDFVASATIADNLMPDILGPQLRSAICEQPTAELRQDVQDFAINQSFRRDIYQRTPIRAAAGATARLMVLSPPEPGTDLSVETSFGSATLDSSFFRPILDALVQQPMSIMELSIRLERPVDDVRQIAFLLLQANVIAIVPSEPSSTDLAQRMNALIARSASEGAPYEHVAAAALASAIRVTQIEMILIDSWLGLVDKEDSAALAAQVGQRLNKLGQKLYHQGQVVSNADAASQLQALASAFLSNQLQQRRQQGVLT